MTIKRIYPTRAAEGYEHYSVRASKVLRVFDTNADGDLLEVAFEVVADVYHPHRCVNIRPKAAPYGQLMAEVRYEQQGGLGRVPFAGYVGDINVRDMTSGDSTERSTQRGPVSLAIKGREWSDIGAAMAVAKLTGVDELVPGDAVKMYDTAASWAQTRTWDGSAWTLPHYVINGGIIGGIAHRKIEDSLLKEVRAIAADVRSLRLASVDGAR